MKIINENLSFQKPLVGLDLTKVKYLIIHHIAKKSATIQDIHNWHIQNGWSGVGYNEYIRKDGTVYIGRGDNIGAQCQNKNSVSYGIALEGNYDEETDITAEQLNSLVERVKFHLNRFPNKVEVKKHGELNPTDCPGKKFPWVKFQDQLKAGTNELEKALKVMVDNGIINSPDYWKTHAVEGSTANGEYVGLIIKRFADYIVANK